MTQTCIKLEDEHIVYLYLYKKIIIIILEKRFRYSLQQYITTPVKLYGNFLTTST